MRVKLCVHVSISVCERETHKRGRAKFEEEGQTERSPENWQRKGEENTLATMFSLIFWVSPQFERAKKWSCLNMKKGSDALFSLFYRNFLPEHRCHALLIPGAKSK